jgi:hypothetical protein
MQRTPAPMGSDTAVSPSDAQAVRFIDFAIRAWREGRYVQVIAHSTPAGAMRQPVAVRLGEFDANDYRIACDAPHSHAAAVGRDLARMLLPHEVWRLLGESLAAISSHPNLGLRIRLCLDDDLIDLPWEFIYRPDVDATAAQSGFLLTDGHISLIREAPSVVTLLPANSNKQRALFIGTMWDDGSDRWQVRSEFTSLKAAMRPVDDLLQFEFVSANNGVEVDAALSVGCDVLHYAGHVDITDGGGTLTQLARMAVVHEPDALFGHQATLATTRQGALEATQHSAPWSSSDVLANRLAGAKTRLAVFNACNSGLWPFMRPLMRAGIPAVIGVQGLVSNIAALNFTEKFYQSLAVGLSLDEALTYARLRCSQRIGRSALVRTSAALTMAPIR